MFLFEKWSQSFQLDSFGALRDTYVLLHNIIKKRPEKRSFLWFIQIQKSTYCGVKKTRKKLEKNLKKAVDKCLVVS